MPIYKIQFINGSIYEGGESILASKWNNIPDMAIASLEYFLDENTSIILKGFEEYNHLIEATKAVYGPKGTDFTEKLHNIYIMGKIGNKVVSYRIALIGEKGSNKYCKGDITKRELEYGKEFRGQKTSNWKRGIE